MKIGVFGGSFDPVHYGHLLVAQQCVEAVGLDKLLFVPVAHSPLKSHAPVADDKARCEMLMLAIADHPQFELSKIEIERGQISFTVDTLQQLRQDWPDAELFLLIGLDSLVDFDRWKQPREILELAQLLVLDRPGTCPETAAKAWTVLANLAPPAVVAQAQAALLQSQRFDFSSTDLRQRIASGQSIRFRTSRAVEKYIQTQNLYASQTSPNEK